MNLTSSGLPGGPLGGLLGRLGGLLGALEASWAVLEASWNNLSRLGGHLGNLGGHLGRLGGHLGPSWSHLGGFFPEVSSLAILTGGRRVGPKPTGEFFWKKNQNHNLRNLARQAPL